MISWSEALVLTVVVVFRVMLELVSFLVERWQARKGGVRHEHGSA
jgi:hypothetical protein